MTKEQQSQLYTEYRDKVSGYIRLRVNNHEDGEDLCADVFEKFFRTCDTYDNKKSSISTWIYTITRNTVIDYYRRLRPTEKLPEELSDESRPEDILMLREQMGALAAALEKLPTELTDIIVLHYYDYEPLTRIADIMGMSYGAVKLRHQKALSQLRTLLA